MKRYFLILIAAFALTFPQAVCAAPRYTVAVPAKENQFLRTDLYTGEVFYSTNEEPRKETPYAEYAAARNAFPAWYADWDGVICEGDLRIADKAGKKSLLDVNGKLISGPWDNINSDASGGFSVTLDGRSGYMDESGNILVQPAYSNISRNELGFYAVDNYNGDIDKDGSEDWLCGLLDPDGNIIVPPEYDYVNQIGYTDKLTSVMYGFYGENAASSIIKTFDTNGKEIERAYPVVEQLGEYVRVVAVEANRNDRYGIEDTDGRLIIKPQYSDIKILTSGLILGGLYNYYDMGPQGTAPSFDYYLIDPSGEKPPVIQPFNRFMNGGEPDEYGNYVLGKNIKPVNPGEVETIRYGYFTNDLKPIIPMEFDVLNVFEDGYAIAAVNARFWLGGKGNVNLQGEQYGLLNMSGDWVIEPQYQHLAYAGHGLYNADKDGVSVVINAQGTRKGPAGAYLEDFDGYIGIQRGADWKCRIVDENGADIAGVALDYMNSFGDGLFYGGMDGKPSELIEIDPGIVDAMPITRRDFAEMAVSLICEKRGITIDELLKSQNIDTDKSPFNDSRDPYVLAANEFGILGATSYHTFMPEGKLSREYASVLAQKIGQILNAAVTWDAGTNPKSGFTRADAKVMMEIICEAE